jgi:hypothetical protein
VLASLISVILLLDLAALRRALLFAAHDRGTSQLTADPLTVADDCAPITGRLAPITFSFECDRRCRSAG